MSLQAATRRLEELRREVERELRAHPPARRPPSRKSTSRKRRDWRDRAVRGALGALLVAVLIVLPFVACVRTTVMLYGAGAPAWLSITGGALLTCGIVAGYGAWISRRVTGRARMVWVGKWIALPLVIGWLGYTLLYLSRVNAKTDAVRGYYTALHPVLRVTLATAILADQQLVVTDMRRVADDYRRMGLAVNDRTRHYVQDDGWVHAVDLRTRERGEIRNRSVELYFRLMGLSTLRHVGTADHLHIQLRGRRQ